ncbi:ABC transporter permease [Cryobacterium sp. 1639]|uniref:ABC transporter permease n=1 Tax=Cryobacterium inferilacus TaxID=2866629 RepID=UPI001C730804|nr:ABC transporter permease [Cryobacterium sp. 1639]MBX0301898.1 ABC transporter permease [Cryobacterium sp. 1639]
MTIIANNLRRMFRKKSSWVYLLLIPVVVNVFIISLSVQEARWVIGVHSAETSEVTESFTDTFGADSTIVIVEDPSTQTASLEDSAYDLGISFPAGYTDSVIAGESPVVTVMDRGDNNQTDSLKQRVDTYLVGVNAIGVAAAGDEARFSDALTIYLEEKFAAEYLNFDLGSTEEATKSVTALGFLAFGLVLMMASAASMLLDDRIRGVYDRVRTTPLRSSSYFVQYFISMGLIAAVQVAVVLAVIPTLTPVSFGTTATQIGGVALSALCFTAFCTALSVLIFRFAKTAIFAATLYSVLTLPMLMLSGALWPRDVMPEAMQRIGDYLPARWFLAAAEEALQDNGFAGLAGPLGLLVGLSAVLIIATFTIRTEKYR